MSSFLSRDGNEVNVFNDVDDVNADDDVNDGDEGNATDQVQGVNADVSLCRTKVCNVCLRDLGFPHETSSGPCVGCPGPVRRFEPTPAAPVGPGLSSLPVLPVEGKELLSPAGCSSSSASGVHPARFLPLLPPGSRSPARAGSGPSLGDAPLPGSRPRGVRSKVASPSRVPHRVPKVVNPTSLRFPEGGQAHAVSAEVSCAPPSVPNVVNPTQVRFPEGGQAHVVPAEVSWAPPSAPNVVNPTQVRLPQGGQAHVVPAEVSWAPLSVPNVVNPTQVRFPEGGQAHVVPAEVSWAPPSDPNVANPTQVRLPEGGQAHAGPAEVSWATPSVSNVANPTQAHFPEGGQPVAARAGDCRRVQAAPLNAPVLLHAQISQTPTFGVFEA
jgi:hypothetical protein